MLLLFRSPSPRGWEARARGSGQSPGPSVLLALPLLMGLQNLSASLLPPTYTHHLGRAGGASQGVPGVDLLTGNGGMWNRAQQSEASHLLLKATASYGYAI